MELLKGVLVMYPIFHTEDGVPWDFPPQAKVSPPQALRTLPYTCTFVYSHTQNSKSPPKSPPPHLMLYKTPGRLSLFLL